MKKIFDLLINVFIPLLIGALIYFWTRPHTIYFLSWIDKSINFRRTKQLHLPTWIKYHLPDTLWIFAFTSLLLIIWHRKIKNESLIWILTPIIIAIGLEFNFGTFDKLDLLFLFIGAALPFIIHPNNQFSFHQK